MSINVIGSTKKIFLIMCLLLGKGVYVPPGSSIQGILQVKTLEWVAVTPSRISA